MASTLSVTLTIEYTPDSSSNQVAIAPASFTDSVSVSGALRTEGTQTIGTSEETLNLGDVATPGYILVKNLDDTNFVQFNVDATPTLYTVKLKPGEFALFRLGDSSAALYCKASVALNIQYWLFSD